MISFKRFWLLFGAVLTTLCLFGQNPQPANWSKLYGDGQQNLPRRVKAFGDGMYVAGVTTDAAGVQYGTFTKFNPLNGSVVWQFQLDIPSDIQDFTHVPVKDEFILVGATIIPGVSGPVDNQSLIVRVDDNGIVLDQRTYQLAGREGFTRVVRHPNPDDPDFPYFALGGKNPDTNAPSSFDEVVLFNFDAALNTKWWQQYTEINNVEIEALRGLIPLSNGQLWLVGNGSIANEGAIIRIQSQKGNPVGPAIYHPDGIDWYDGIELPNGEVALAGERFSSGNAIMMIVDQVNGAPQAGLLFQDVQQFKELGFTTVGAPAGAYRLYGLGEDKTPPLVGNVMHQVTYQPGVSITKDYSRYLNDGATDWTEAHFSVTPSTNRIFYADGRQYATPVFGDWEMMVGSYPLDFSAFCTDDHAQTEQGYSVAPTNFTPIRLRRTPTQSNPPALPTSLPYACENSCAPTPTCTADFSWEADCCEATFTTNVTGTAPFFYSWDIGCDFSVESTSPNPTLSFPAPGTYPVCLIVTDATGCQVSVQKNVTVVDDPPVLTCPDVLLPTDPGECFATYNPVIDVTDDCTPDDRLRPFCQYSGAVTGPGPFTEFPKGVTTVTCLVEDGKGQMASCTYTITVEDREPPQIVCPSPAPVTVPACDGGAKVTFAPPVATDNCPMVTTTQTHQSGQFFPCGTTMVTYTATDMAGLTSSCSFPVTVNCSCAEIKDQDISCSDVDDEFNFGISVRDLTGGNPSNCTVTVRTLQSNVSVNYGVANTGSSYIITGTLSLTGPPVPLVINLVVDVTCICPDGSVHTCSFPVNLETPCCKKIEIDDQALCRLDDQVQINLLGCNTLYDVQRVRWYVADAPCTAGTVFGPPLQVTSGCDPLILSPRFHNGDVCVYAEVDMGPQAGPCRTLRTEVTRVRLCEPVGCTLQDQAYCYAGTPITPAPLTVAPQAGPNSCDFTVQWYDDNGIIPGATGLTYQPPALSLPAGSTDCSQSFTYRAVITAAPCGDLECSATIRLDNEAAPDGTLDLLPPDVLPFCPGEDAILEYTPECAGSPERWTWQESQDGVTYVDITTNGDRNPRYQTNRLFRDTWYRIEKQNGVCPVDQIDLFLDVRDPLVVSNFVADHAPKCDPTSIKLQLDISPQYASAADCSYTIEYYHNGRLFDTQTSLGGTAGTNYFAPASAPLSGNFYAIVSSNCCDEVVQTPVITLDPPMEVTIAGPCFRCKKENVRLDGIVLNPPAGFTCTYQWYRTTSPTVGNDLLPGETGTTLIVDPSWKGPFVFEVTCTDGVTTCVKRAVYTLKQCGGNDCVVSINNVPVLDANVYPNPADDRVFVELESPRAMNGLSLFDMNGRLVRTYAGEGPQVQYELDLSGLAAGTYVLRAQSTQGELVVTRIIKR
ncbi:HYR domain-containing protein [Lewinella sp. W8]|uniref:HYR domain-containing protein n=1 Tax=Lewinella sp. W8 TaxID=2528208 RepID=UPI001067E9E0|nr:HYR domain-containing protein [Lewinella sp. W8]MTB53820.1 HYR domain-containing protein [Lewinella sp. W8]